MSLLFLFVLFSRVFYWLSVRKMGKSETVKADRLIFAVEVTPCTFISEKLWQFSLRIPQKTMLCSVFIFFRFNTLLQVFRSSVVSVNKLVQSFKHRDSHLHTFTH